MSDVLARAKAHWAKRDTETVLVPEWGDERGPLRVVVRPMTMGDRSTILRKHRRDGVLDEAEALLTIVIRNATTDDGAPLFEEADRLELRKSVDPNVLARIAAAATGAGGLEDLVEDAEKN